MPFWDPAFQEPLRQYRWYVEFGGPLLPALRYSLKKVEKPKAKVNDITHKFLNHFFYYPGRVEWEPISMTMVAVNSPTTGENSSASFYTLLKAAGYTWPGDAQNGAPQQLATVSKNRFTGLTGPMDIVQIDAGGNRLETFRLINPFFTTIQFGSLDYASEEVVDITLNIRYDTAQFNP